MRPAVAVVVWYLVAEAIAEGSAAVRRIGLVGVPAAVVFVVGRPRITPLCGVKGSCTLDPCPLRLDNFFPVPVGCSGLFEDADQMLALGGVSVVRRGLGPPWAAKSECERHLLC